MPVRLTFVGVLIWVSASIPGGTAPAGPPNTTIITGKTYRWVKDAEYVSLPRVRIYVFRDGAVVADAAGNEFWESAADGSYRVVIRAGRPAQIVFHLSRDYVPEVQYLAAKPRETHSVSVGLITVADYQRLEKTTSGTVPLAARLRAVESLLPSDSALRKELPPSPGEDPKLAKEDKLLHILVPAYFYPGGEGQKQWDLLISTGKKAGVPIVVIVNPSSDPGDAADPNYSAVVKKARDAGLRLLGYVHTEFGARDSAAVLKDIDRWKKIYPQIEGIFFDTLANQSAKVSYYAALYEHARKTYPGGLVVGNPGTLCPEEYVTRRTADALCIYENRTAKRLADVPLPTWTDKHPEARFAALFYDEPMREEMVRLIGEAAKTRIQFIYCTDAHRHKGELNPWTRLPLYWEEELAAVKAANRGLGK